MVLRLDPSRPVLWRTPGSVQIGAVAPAAVVDVVVPGAERLLAALTAGISRSGYDMLARASGVAADDAEDLLVRLGPALTVPVSTAGPAVAVLGDSPVGRAIAGLLPRRSGARAPADHGTDPAPDPENADLVVLAADWVVAPADHARWLRRDIRHLPVVTVDGAVHIGPLVVPGITPCLHCVHLARTDADPAWPAVATQLWGRAPSTPSPLLVAEAAARAVRIAVAQSGLTQTGAAQPGAAQPGAAQTGAAQTGLTQTGLTQTGSAQAGVEWRLDEAGRVSSTTWSRHPECSCAALPGTGSDDAPAPAVRAVPRTGRAVAARG